MKDNYWRSFASGHLLKAAVIAIFFVLRYIAEFGRGAEHPFLHAGLSAVLFIAIYQSLCCLYANFQKDRSEASVFAGSHIFSLIPVDILLWMEAVQTWPGADAPFIRLALIPAALQAAAVLLYTFLVRPVLKKKILPESAALVAASKEARIYEEAAENGDKSPSAWPLESFAGRMNRRDDMPLRIQRVLSEDLPVQELCEKIGDCPVVVLCGVSSEKREALTAYCRGKGKLLYYMPETKEYSFARGETEYLLDKAFIRADFRKTDQRFRLAIKRAADIVVSAALLILLSPLMLAAACAVRAGDGGPALFSQKRYTLDGRVFNILKFRTMKMTPEDNGVYPFTENDSRITHIGGLLRRYHIDELPQLINILKGDMSLVGPRPEQVELADLYSKHVTDYPERLRVRAGLTGLAQVYGRYSIEPADKLRLDLMYIENQSFLTDLKILLLTAVSVFRTDAAEGFDAKRSGEIHDSVGGGMPGKDAEQREDLEEDSKVKIPAEVPAFKEKGRLRKLPETAFYILVLFFCVRSLVGRMAWTGGSQNAALFMKTMQSLLETGVWLLTAAVIYIRAAGEIRDSRGKGIPLLLKRILRKPAVHGLLIILAGSVSAYLLCRENLIILMLLVYLSGFADERKTAALLLGFFTAGIIFTAFTWMLGLTEDVICTFSYGICHSFGFSNPNSMGFYYFSAFLLLWYLYGNRGKLSFAAAGACVSALCFITCGCRTASILMLFLVVYGIWMKELPERTSGRAARAGVTLMPVFMFLLSAAAGITLYPLDDKIHSNFIVRVVDCVYAFRDAGLSLLPQSFDGFERFYYFDNGYYYWLFCNGILAALSFLVPVLYFNYKAAGKGRRVINVLIFCAAVYYSMERLSLVLLLLAVAFAGVFQNNKSITGITDAGE